MKGIWGLLVVVGHLWLAGAAAARQCAAHWEVRWAPSNLPVECRALAVFDDGNGPALIAGVDTTAQTSVQGVWRWEENTWVPFGTGATLNVFSFTVFDDGSGHGPQLYVGGLGGGAIRGVGKLNGSRWEQVGAGIPETVRALAVFDDGTGPALYAAGFFTSAGGPANRLAKWTGTAWVQVGGGLDGNAYSLQVFDDGSGPALYVGGGFRHAGGVPATGIAKWDGNTFSALGAGVEAGGLVVCMHVAAMDGTPSLYIGGQFRYVAGQVANGVARWDGSEWSTLGAGVVTSGFVSTLIAYSPDGVEPARLFAGGGFSGYGSTGDFDYLAVWDGQEWSGAAGSADSYVRAFVPVDGSNGRRLVAAGAFSMIAGMTASRAAAWDGQEWIPMGDAVGGADGSVSAFHPGPEPGTMYIGGSFLSIAGEPVQGVGLWDGSTWSQVGAGFYNNGPSAFAPFDFGAGPQLCAAGIIIPPTGRVARWDGSDWTAVGTNLDNPATCLAPFPAGARAELYVGGLFYGWSAVKKWNGSLWIDCGSLGFGGSTPGIWALAELQADDPVLVAGGSFWHQPTRRIEHIAAWDGTAWKELGWLDERVWTLRSFDDGRGLRMYAGGDFTGTFGHPGGLSHVARWNGQRWEALGEPGAEGVNGVVKALEVFDDGSGPALFVAGDFTHAGDVEAIRIAKWDGVRWHAVGTGVLGQVRVLRASDAPGRRSLWVGGTFVGAGGRRTRGLAEWVACACRADWNNSGSVNSQDFFDFLASYFSGEERADFNADGAVDSSDFFAFVDVWVAGCS